LPPLFSGLARRPRRRQIEDTGDAAQSKSALAQRLHGLAPDEQHDLLVGMVCLQAAAVLGRPGPEDIDPEAEFQDLGFDSLTAVELRNRLKSVTGLAPMNPRQALELLDAALVIDHPVMVATRLDRAALDALAQSGGLPALFSGLARRPRRRQIEDTGDATQSKSALAQRLNGLAPSEQHDLLVGLVCLQAAAVLGRPSPKDIDPEAEFQDLGFDSLTAVELRNRLKTATGLTLPPTLIFDHPTPTAVADYVGQQIPESHRPESNGEGPRLAEPDDEKAPVHS
jgi:acyl carrier protein